MVSLVVRVWWCCCGVLCCLGGWWGPLVDVDVAPGDFDAVGAMACGVVVSTLGWGPGGWRWWRLFASRGGVLGGVVDGGALGVTLCRGRRGGDGGVLGVGAGGDGPMVRVPGTLGGSALLGLLLAIPGGGCWRWCRWW